MAFANITTSRVTKCFVIGLLLLVIFGGLQSAGADQNDPENWDERYNALTLEIQRLEAEHAQSTEQTINLTKAIASLKVDIDKIILVAYKTTASEVLPSEFTLEDESKVKVYTASVVDSHHGKIADYYKLTVVLAEVKARDDDLVLTLNRKKAEIAQVQAFLDSRPTLVRDSEDHRIMFPNVPAPNPQVQAVVDFAYAQLGKPYVYATAGPVSFDCSGLTLAAWQTAGIRLPHFSGAQMRMTRRISANELLPGDLVFYGPGGSNHVSLYVGDGKVIAAPHTGTVVQVQTLRSGASGYGRVW